MRAWKMRIGSLSQTAEYTTVFPSAAKRAASTQPRLDVSAR